MTPGTVELFIGLVGAIFASSGFWAWIMRRTEKKDSRLELLLGLAHDRIIHVGKGYVKRGYITYDEFDDFQKYLYLPYAKFGGNGFAEQMYKEVLQLPHQPPKKTKEENEQQQRQSRPDPYCLNYKSSDEQKL